MATPRSHLEKAPIVEALIDFRVLPQVEIDVDELRDLGNEVGIEYSNKEPLNLFSTQIDFNQGQLQQSAQAHSKVGWLFRAPNQVAQFRVNGFTFSRLEPYTTWGEVFGEAIRLWKIYVTKARPKQVSRIAVRYLNRMRVQAPAELTSFLTAPPVLPGPISQNIRDFLSRIHVSDTKRNASAVIIQALEPQVESSVISLLLDIDAYRDGLAMDPSDPSIPTSFELLRQLKNEIFFASVTEQAVEMYQ